MCGLEGRWIFKRAGQKPCIFGLCGIPGGKDVMTEFSSVSLVGEGFLGDRQGLGGSCF